MKLINYELRDKIWCDVSEKVFKHAPYDSPVCIQIGKKLGLRLDNDSPIRLKIYNLQWYIKEDLNETS